MYTQVGVDVDSLFLLNARSETLAKNFLTQSRAGGYLFPPARATSAVVSALAERTGRYPVIADNGAFDDVGRIVAEAGKAGVFAEPVSIQLEELRDRTSSFRPDVGSDTQIAVRPDAIIGPEDITVAVWLRAGLAYDEMKGERAWLRRQNRRIAVQGVAAAKLVNFRVMCVASAFDYNSAKEAGAEFFQRQVSSAAIGFGAVMSDDGWTTHLKLGRKTYNLGAALPSRYLTAALIARGFFDEWGGVNDRFHFLGLGAPIMMPIARLCSRNLNLATFDATSPIKDASNGSMYTTKPAPLTVRVWNIADRIARLRQPWTCPCSFCRNFLKLSPMKIDVAGDTIEDKFAKRRLSAEDLTRRSVMANALPLFRIGNSAAAKRANQARVGHNHWVLGCLCRRLSGSQVEVEEFVRQRVMLYEKWSSSSRYAESVRLAYEIAMFGKSALE